MEHIRPPIKSDPIPITAQLNPKAKLIELREAPHGHPLVLNQWSVDRKSVTLSPRSLLQKAFHCIRQVLQKEYPKEVMGIQSGFEIELVDDVSDHASKALNFNALNGMHVNIKEREQWCVVHDGAALAFRLGRFPGHKESLCVIVAYFNWRDVLTIDECRDTIEQQTRLPLEYPHMRPRLRIKWENVGRNPLL